MKRTAMMMGLLGMTIVHTGCKEKSKKQPEPKATEGAGTERGAGADKTKPEQPVGPVKALEGELTAEWLLANAPAVKTGGALLEWTKASATLEKQYGKPTFQEAKGGNTDYYWGKMQKRTCVYIKARVQGEHLLDIRPASKEKFGTYGWETCLKAANTSMEKLKKEVPIAAEGKKVKVGELLDGVASNPEDWATASVTVTGKVKQTGSQTVNGKKTFRITLTTENESDKRLDCNIEGAEPKVKSGAVVAVTGWVDYRFGNTNARPTIADCAVKK